MWPREAGAPLRVETKCQLRAEARSILLVVAAQELCLGLGSSHHEVRRSAPPVSPASDAHRWTHQGPALWLSRTGRRSYTSLSVILVGLAFRGSLRPEACCCCQDVCVPQVSLIACHDICKPHSPPSSLESPFRLGRPGHGLLTDSGHSAQGPVEGQTVWALARGGTVLVPASCLKLLQADLPDPSNGPVCVCETG